MVNFPHHLFALRAWLVRDARTTREFDIYRGLESQLKRIFWIVIGWKMVIYISLLFLGKSITTFGFESFQRRWPPSGPVQFLSRLGTWDAAHYLHLANKGYSRGDVSCAFYPLWPLILHATGAGSAKYAPLYACALAFSLWAASTWLLYSLLRHIIGGGGAFSVLICHNLLPSSIFFWLGYSESLFFFLSVICFGGWYSRRWWMSVIGAFFLPLSRPVGILCVIPLVLLAAVRPKEIGRWLAMAAALCGFAIYLVLMNSATGNPLEGFAAQYYFTNAPSVEHLLHPWEFVIRFMHIHDWHHPINSVLDRAMFVLETYFIVKLWNMDRIICLWCIPMVIIPAFSTWFLSFSRFTIVVWPSLLGAVVMFHRMPANIVRIYAVAMLVFQGLLLNRYFAFEWAN